MLTGITVKRRVAYSSKHALGLLQPKVLRLRVMPVVMGQGLGAPCRAEASGSRCGFEGMALATAPTTCTWTGVPCRPQAWNPVSTSVSTIDRGRNQR